MNHHSKKAKILKIVPILQVQFIASIAIVLAGCTTTDTTNKSSQSTLQLEINYLGAEQVRAEFIGQTISGSTHYKNIGNIQFQFYFEPETNIFRDRLIVRNKVTLATGAYEITEEGSLCRSSRARRAGKQTCWNISKQGDQFQIHNTSENQTTEVMLMAGKHF